MLVQCPKCKTTYRVADDLLKGAAPAFRCSRCKHTFDLDWQEPIKPLPPKSSRVKEFTPQKEDDRELTFSFSPREKIMQDDPRGAGDPAKDDSLCEVGGGSSERWSISGEIAAADEPFTISEGRESHQEIKDIEIAPDSRPNEASIASNPLRQEGGNNIVAFNNYRDQQASTLPLLTVLALLVVFYSILTAFQQVNPTRAESWIKTIPLFGSAVLRNSHIKKGVLLQSLRGIYQSIQGNREVFMVTGVAVNQNPVVIRDVQIAGKLFDQEGKEIEQQTIWLGNAISPKIVRGMTAQDILNLQRLKSLKQFEIPPGDSVPFTVVFLKSLKGLKDFSCEILSAEGSV
jgi:predicted Zn finger-like uncharacterized protein